MSASSLKSKLNGDLSELGRTIGALEAERRSLALPAHSGDEDAMLRVVELRSEIAEKQSSVRDLQQALADVEPAVLIEQATVRLQRREALHEQYQAARGDVIAAMEGIDAAVQQLAQAFRDAAGPVALARQHAVDMTAPIDSSGDMGHQAIGRMMIAQSIGIRSVQDLIETALEDVHILTRSTAPFPLRPNMKLTSEMRRSLEAVSVRVQEALAADRRTSAQAGVVLEPA